MTLNRRDLLKLPAASLLIPGTASAANGYQFHHDHIMGTSLDLVVFAASERAAESAETAVLAEIARLSRILSTYDPQSEVSRLAAASGGDHSPELTAVLAAYEAWNRRSGGAIGSNIGGKLNLDALGKPFIAAKAVETARATVAGISGMMLDAGGDVIVSGTPGGAGTGRQEAWEVGVADPLAPYDNARPLTVLTVGEGAVATSGITARGAHIVDPRTGQTATSVLSATVIAPDAITANALATAICVLGPAEGLRLVERTRGAESLIVSAAGVQSRSAGFSRFERPVMIPAMQAANWPQGFEVVIELNLKDAGTRRPYVGLWVEDMSKHFVRNIAIFYQKPRYLNDLRAWYDINANTRTYAGLSRPTPSPGRYTLHWEGLDEKKNPAPQGTYKIVIETAREHSYYTKEFAQITCGEEPATAVSKKSPEFDAMQVTYGPKKQAI